MIPDRIYIPQHNIEAGTIQELDGLIVEGSVEYIRKDTLMEWAKNEMKKFRPIPYANGEMRMLNALIDKLNELCEL